MAEILVVKVNVFLKTKEFNDLYKYIASQKDHGIILLPPYCDAQVVPEGVEIVVEDMAKNKRGEK